MAAEALKELFGRDPAHGQVNIGVKRKTAAPRQRAKQDDLFCAKFGSEQIGGFPGSSMARRDGLRFPHRTWPCGGGWLPAGGIS